jgi:hypothetical protein
MGKLKDTVQDWLSDYGYEKGYDWHNLPEFSQLNEIQNKQITAKEYLKWKELKKKLNKIKS